MLSASFTLGGAPAPGPQLPKALCAESEQVEILCFTELLGQAVCL